LLLGAVAGVVVARSLAPGGRGSYAVVVTIAGTAVALCHMSLEQAHVSMWKNEAQRRALIANAVALGLGIGVLAAAASYGIVHLLGRSRLPVYDDRGLILALAAVPLALLALYTKSLVALRARVDMLNRAMLLSAVVQTAALIGLAVIHELSVTSVVALWTLTSALPLLVTLPLLRPRASELSAQVMRAELMRGIRYHGGVALLFLLFRADVFLVNAMKSREAVGLYALAVTLAELVYLLSDSVAQAIVARQASGDVEDATAITALAMRMTLLGAAGVAGALAVAGPWLLPLAYGQAFRDSVVPFLILLPGVVAFAVGRPVAALLAAVDAPWLVAGLSAAAFAIDLVLAVLLIPPLGIAGAAWASTVAYTLLCLGYMSAACSVADLNWADFVPRMAEVRGMARPHRG
jgi:O-antigen/teichoic acid export membrane protein